MLSDVVDEHLEASQGHHEEEQKTELGAEVEQDVGKAAQNVGSDRCNEWGTLGCHCTFLGSNLIQNHGAPSADNQKDEAVKRHCNGIEEDGLPETQVVARKEESQHDEQVPRHDEDKESLED